MAPTALSPEDFQDLFKPYSPLVTIALPVTAALALHAAVQIREPYAHHSVIFLGLVLFGTHSFIKHAWKVDNMAATVTVAGMLCLFSTVMAASITIYRVFFHPLRHIPGPLSCKISMWTWVKADWEGKRAHIIRELHEKYGSVVRIGPREVSCANPAAIPLVYGPTGPSSTFIRGPWYTAQSTMPDIHSLQNEPTLPEHSRRRRDWDPAFSIKALAGYKSNIQRNAETLLDQVARLSRDGLVDIRECMMWFGFDVMGELGFGRSFGTLEAAKTSAVVHLVELGVRSSKQPQFSISIFLPCLFSNRATPSISLTDYDNSQLDRERPIRGTRHALSPKPHSEVRSVAVRGS